ncbi:hypothetical protein J8L70_03660 [Pseudoalteromonas sp. MMG010]|uniref:hypothetical protein n=1 Tax=Pseudoalteromonas sp. MMG010 TaxID=2822685 RepID=UPI001B39E0CF|nr:hypothetical protein [Pseudoalteromonas sp. MMG010]MBQ4832330.1 hypothetical protein [Pseudoalteromonas sp. MMG010]
MGNLFLKEKENWLAWSIWAIVGAFSTFYVAVSTQTPYFFAVASLVLLGLLTIWMQQSKRFDFLRAFKITFYVAIVSILPVFFLVVAPKHSLHSIDLIFQAGVIVALSTLICLICSFIAKKPKQYY